MRKAQFHTNFIAFTLFREGFFKVQLLDCKKRPFLRHYLLLSHRIINRASKSTSSSLSPFSSTIRDLGQDNPCHLNSALDRHAVHSVSKFGENVQEMEGGEMFTYFLTNHHNTARPWLTRFWLVRFLRWHCLFGGPSHVGTDLEITKFLDKFKVSTNILKNHYT